MCLPNGLQPGAVKARCSRAAVRPSSSSPPSSTSETNGSDLCLIMRNCISMEQSSMASATLRLQKGHLIAAESSYHRSSRSSTEVDVSVLSIAAEDCGLAGDVLLVDLACDVVVSSDTRDDEEAEGVGEETPLAGENAPASSGTDRVNAINNAVLLDRDEPSRLLLWPAIALL